MTVIHIAGLPLQVGAQHRQRCGWCGAVIDDVDLSHIASSGDGSPYPEWEPGVLVAVDGDVRWAVHHDDGDVLPDEACGQLDPAVTL